jgi:ATP-dependent DNA helicase PIF1
MAAQIAPDTSANTFILSEDQQKVFDLYKNGKNVFMTGPGGTGKSALIRYIVEDAKANGKKIDVCALTGCAAVLLNCNAKTIHSWAGVGLAKESAGIIADKVVNHKAKKKNWMGVQILIIDEVSMLSLKLFETLDLIGKKIKMNKLPFGGIQVIFSGDFFQLPPVGDHDDIKSNKFCFESKLWVVTFPNQIQLRKMFRQKDEKYAKILNQIRVGKISKNSCALLKSYVGRVPNQDEIIKPTILYPRRRDAEIVNNNNLKKLNGEIYSYKVQECNEEDLELTENEKNYSNVFSPQQIEYEQKQLLAGMNCDKTLELKVGAQVMCIVNLDMDSENPICNGSQGIVQGFNEKGAPIIKFRNGTIRTIGKHNWKSDKIPSVGVKQIPLILAWAVTIHKSQGATLEIAEIDIGNNIFACGQTYVALSRVKNLDGLYLKSFNPYKIKINLKVKEYYENL